MNGFVFDKGIDITPVQSPMGFTYGAGVFGPEVEIRRLEDIRASLRDPQCKGPEQVYSIAMDVGKEEHRALLNKLHLLFGVVTYSAGKLVTEALGYTRGNHRGDLLGWWDAICLYDNVVGLMELPIEEQERLKEERVRLAVRVRQVEDDMIEQFARMGEVSSVDVGQVFYILAKREFVACNEKYEKKE